ncbi:MAG: hypothetical protein PHY73_07885 [Candidatus Omnitrophica bacterium]|nr:hypothetical protein [Candidatus Omnitrophota bacterium]
MKRKFFILLMLCVFVFAFCLDSFAGLIDWERRNRYLKERQQESGAEVTVGEEALPKWMKQEPRVTTREEKRYDSNRDGRFQPAESKVYLRRIVQIVDRGGKVIAQSEILKEYDKNKDGVITSFELKEIKEDVF